MKLQHPVIIAGAGPSGSVLALYLAKQDIPVILLEKHAQLPIDLRASTFHPPSLEMIADLEPKVIEKMLAKGLKADRYQYRDRRTNETATFDMALLEGETRYPFRLQLEQYELTHFIVEELKQYPCAQIKFEHELLSFSQDEDGINARVATPDGETELHGSFLVGADGARSNVRKSSAIGFLGFTYDEKFLVVSTSFAFEEVFDDFSYVNYVSDPDEWCVILRTDKIWRVLVPVTINNDDDERHVLSDDFVQERLKRIYDQGSDYHIGHRTLYAVNQRVAETYHQGRMALVGDACHINNPLGGMGMNGGLHDAFNLAERLVRIARQGTDYQQEFTQYDRQRKDLAVRFVQEHTIQNKQLMESTDPYVQAKRQQWLMEMSVDPVKAKEFLLERAMINCVRDSLAVE
ncbi:FAD-dependent monooxygenase [Aestuariicella hydrocarbonica]|uniref:FAD-dependent monooxygenase n=1 Tax=Pseudomaricurvus hydrocarbonicus TaxID=1470433 RepID=A0A9E5T3S3_9GAMM|nr:NAD(P)/FAD-dependent oxidoreductase [Aestuariicella hydrocarbonica]NHO67249.1 FAD-dependent monooxygenase [Aestuariicella hydrocarbonica]